MHSQNKKLHIDTITKILTLTDGHLREEYISKLISIKAVTPELYQYIINLKNEF